MKSKNWTPKFIALAVICFLVGVGTGLLGYHYFVKPEIILSMKIEQTMAMVEKVIYYEDTEQKVIGLKSEDGIEIVSLLACTLHELNSQCKCIWSEREIEEMKQKDKCVELVFQIPTDVTISQWIEPEERYHIPVDERGYRILGINNALFIMEDNLGEALGAYILTGHEYEGNISYGGWAIIKGRDKLDKSWVYSLDRMISELP